jgi:hypothetical protein
MKFNAFMKEFPFLIECTKWNDTQGNSLDCDSIKIANITSDLLAHSPRYKGATGSLVGIDNGERFDFVLSDGQIIKNAVASGGSVIHNEAHTDNEYYDGETVLEGIDKHQVAKCLAFIVKISYGYNIRDHHSLNNYSIIIYKPAKNFALIDIIAAANEKALADVRAEADF